MRQFSKIVSIVLPCLFSISLTRTIIVYGPELWVKINEIAYESFSLILSTWELDHATFGFTLGIPMMLFTLFLILIRYHSVMRMFLATLLYHTLQILSFLVILEVTVEVFPMPFSSKELAYLPNHWFFNSALIIASITAFILVIAVFLLLRFRERKIAPDTLDQGSE
ncbi:MAG: hypothetical protein ACFHU9_04955 [Fluviicola sp.]